MMASGEVIKAGRVLKISGEKATVQIAHALTCSGDDPNCPYNAMYFDVTTGKTIEVEAENVMNAEVGDLVNVRLPSQHLLKGVAFVYGGLMLVIVGMLLAGCFLSKLLHFSAALLMVFAGILSIFLGAKLLCILDRRFHPQYTIVQIVQSHQLLNVEK